MNPNAPVTESINQRILELLGLEETFDLDYATYVQSLKERLLRVTAFGEKLSSEDFKLLKNELKRVKQKEKTRTFKIKPDKFVGKKKPEAKAKITPKKLLLPSSRALSKVTEVEDKSKAIQRLKTKEKEPIDILSRIDEKLSSILETLMSASKLQNKQLDLDRKERENKKRQEKESRLEKGGKLVGTAVQKILAPFQNIFERVWNFIKFTLLGRAFTMLMDWFADPKNKGKVETIGRFLKDWWPALLGAYGLFMTPLGGLVRTVIGTVVRFTFQITKFAIPRLLSIVKANPLTSLIVATSVAGTLARTGERERLKPEVEKQRESVRKTEEDKNAPWYQKLGGFFAKQELTTGQQQQAIVAPVPGAMYATGGYVSGEPGIDKVPAMLTDGEFVMSRGAVAKFGTPFLESLNAAGGGTNKPRIVSGTTYAVTGGPVGRRGKDTGEYGNNRGNKNDKNSVFYFINKFFRDRNVGGPNFDIRNPRTWNKPSQSGNNLPKSGGGSGGFLGGLGFVGRAANEASRLAAPTIDRAGKFIGEVPRFAGGVANEAYKLAAPTLNRAGNIAREGYKLAAPTLNRAGKVVGEAKKRAGGVANEVYKRVAPTLSRAGKVAGEVKKKVDPVVKGIPGFVGNTIGGLKPFLSTLTGASQEAVPALIASTLGLSRTDKGISQDMQKQILAAMEKAKKAGKNKIDYSDYGSGAFGGRRSAAGLTMGMIGMDEFKRDEKGRIIGLRQIYDTSTTTKKAMEESKGGFSQFGSSLLKGNPDFDALMKGVYKAPEALLAATQHRGMTMHDVNFDEKVLGFKPGQEVLSPTQKKIIAAQKNREALQDKRPWWDKMGLFGGASAQMQNEQKKKQEFAKNNPSVKLYNKPQANTAQPYQSKFARPKASTAKPSAKPSAKPKAAAPKPQRAWYDPRGWVGKQGGGYVDESFGANIAGGTADRQLAALQPGEYVLPVDVVNKLGSESLNKLVAAFDSNSTPAKLGYKSNNIPQITPYSPKSSSTTLPPIKSSSGGSGSMPSSPSSLPDFAIIPASGAETRMANANLLGIV